MSNYPPGVSDNHPYFNPSPEVEMVCGADETNVVPSYPIREALRAMDAELFLAQRQDPSVLAETLQYRIKALLEEINRLEQDSPYYCDYEGIMEPDDEDTVICPDCGQTHDTA